MPVFNDDVLNPYGRMYNQLRKAADRYFTPLQQDRATYTR